MICPYCGREMESGLIQNRYKLGWFPGTKRHFSANPDFYDGAVTLAEQRLMYGAACRAFLCRECGKVIIDIADENSDLSNR